MQIFRDEWWATPIWYFDIPIEEVDYNKVTNECYLEKSKSEGRIRSNKNGWQSNDIYPNPNIPNISNLIKTIVIYSKTIMEDYGVTKKIDLALDNFWININSPSSSNTLHTHDESALSGVYYAKAPKNSGNISMHNNFMMKYINGAYLDLNNKITCSEVKYEPVAGRVLIFPAWLPHHVEINNSNEDRVSIAFNFSGKYNS
jgi:uncharacterized protein (TIGR02466 family)